MDNDSITKTKLMYSLIQKTIHTGTHPQTQLLHFSNYFYSKYYCGRLMTSPDAKGEVAAHAAGHNHQHRGPARFRSLDFGERNGYLKGPARFHSLNFGERKRVPQGCRTHRCSAEEHGVVNLLMQPRQRLDRDAVTEIWLPWLEEISSNIMNWPT